MDQFHGFLLMAEGLEKQSQNGGAGLAGTPGMVMKKWWLQTKRRPPRRSEGDDGQLGDHWQPVIQACLLRLFKCQ
jgi:hypothetical protein